MLSRALVVLLACALMAGPAWADENLVVADPDGGVARAYFPSLKLSPATVKRTGQEPGNVLWIVIDALRPDHMGCYGYSKPTTPFLDSLADDSLVFLNAYTNAPWTRPATASMLTGLYPSRHRTQTDKSELPKDIETIGEALQKRGYQTGAVVANGNASSVAGLDRGFTHYVDTKTRWEGLPAAGEVYDEAHTWLKKTNKGKQPWFMYIFLLDPHDPYNAPPEYEERWLGKDFKGEPRRRAHWEFENDYPKRERDSMLAVYNASIRYTDDQTRRFFDQLRKMGALDNTTVIITADHGEGFGEHGVYLHAHHHYDEIIRVPLIVSTPAMRGKGHVFHLVQLVDLFPTLVSLAGGTPPADLSGHNLADTLTAPVDRDRLVYTEYNEFGIRRSSLFNLRHRVIMQLPANRDRFLLRIPKAELLPSVSFEEEVVRVYDRRADPRDRRALSPAKASKEAQAMVKRLRLYMEATPASNNATDEIPQSVYDDLESLGYME